jgi:hypothetical protein
MIDFSNKKFLKLKQDPGYASKVEPLLVHDEMILDSYKSVRDGVVFTDRRIISVNVQGLTGKKVDFTSIPYNKIVLFSVETAGTFDLDAELDIRVSGMNQPIRFEFRGSSKVVEISKYIAQAI